MSRVRIAMSVLFVGCAGFCCAAVVHEAYGPHNGALMVGFTLAALACTYAARAWLGR